MKKSYPNYLYQDDGVRIFYSTNFKPSEKNNDKPLIVFNYGLVCSNDQWSKQLPFFDKQGYNILIHNYRGHFNSTGIDDLDSITLKNIRDDLHGILKKINAKKIVLVGHSMGVNVCVDYTQKYPKDVIGLVLISGSVMPPTKVMFDTNIMSHVMPILKTVRETFPEVVDFLWKTGGFNPIIQKSMHMGGFNSKTVSKEFVSIYINRISRLRPELFLKLFQEMVDHDIMPFLKKITIPSLVVIGDDDKVIPHYIQKIIYDELPNSQLYTVEDGSHVPQADFPEYVNQRIELFINEL